MDDEAWSSTQTGVFVVSAVLFAWSLVGLIVNPDFTIGTAGTTKRVLGVEMNGWHAVSGLLLNGPGMFFARRHLAALAYALATAGALLLSAGLIAVDHSPAGLVNFRHAGADVALHTSFGVAYLVVAALSLPARRRPRVRSTG